MGEVLQGMEGLLLVWWKIRSGILLPVLYLVMMTVVILWGGSLQERIFQQGARKAMGWGILVWLIWLGIRLLRLILEGWVRWEWLHRLLWYGFYPCMGLLIFLAVWVSYASNRTPEDRALPLWLKGLLVLDLILAALALTNDWHQLVFRIRPSANPHWDVYTYGAGYYLILFSYLAQLLLANGWLCWRAYKEKISLGKLWLPFGLILLYGGYIAAYILRIPWFFRSEFVLRTALFGFLWMEVLLRSRLLPGNSQYRDCFLHSRLGLTILDRQGRTVYQCRQLPTRPEGDWQRRTMPISGGQVVWYQDMGELRRKKEKLELTAQTLQRVYRLRRKSEKIQRERIHQETRKRIYEEVAEKVSKSRSAVTNALRLLKLEESVQKKVEFGVISAGHARALAAIEDKEVQREVADQIIDRGLSVRETEKVIGYLLHPVEEDKKDPVQAEDKSVVYRTLEETLKTILGSKVVIKPKKNGKGKIEIDYYSIDELDRISDMLKRLKV